MVLGFILGVVVGAVLVIAVIGGALLLSARPARARYAVHYHEYDSEGRRVEGTQEVDAMNETHAESLVRHDVFGEYIDDVELIEQLT